MISIPAAIRRDQIDGRVVLAMQEAIANEAFLIAYEITDPRRAKVWARFATGAGDLARTTVEELDNLAEAPPP